MRDLISTESLFYTIFLAPDRRLLLGGWSAPHLSSEGEGPASPAPAAAARTQTRPRRPRTFPWGCALRNRCSGSRRPAPRQPPRAERPPWPKHSWRRNGGGHLWLLPKPLVAGPAARGALFAGGRPAWQRHSRRQGWGQDSYTDSHPRDGAVELQAHCFSNGRMHGPNNRQRSYGRLSQLPPQFRVPAHTLQRCCGEVVS